MLLFFHIYILFLMLFNDQTVESLNMKTLQKGTEMELN